MDEFANFLKSELARLSELRGPHFKIDDPPADRGPAPTSFVPRPVKQYVPKAISDGAGNVWSSECEENLRQRMQFLLAWRQALENRNPRETAVTNPLLTSIFEDLCLFILEHLADAIGEALQQNLPCLEKLRVSLLELIGDQVAAIATEVVAEMKGGRK